MQQFAEVTGHPVRLHPQFFSPNQERMPEGAFSLHQILWVAEGQPSSSTLDTSAVCNELRCTRVVTMAVQIDVA